MTSAAHVRITLLAVMIALAAVVAGCGGGESGELIAPTTQTAGVAPSATKCEMFVGLLLAAQLVEAESADPSDLAAELVSGTNEPNETTLEAQEAALGACPDLAGYVQEYASQSSDGATDSVSNHQVWLACRVDPQRTTPVCGDVPTIEPAQPSAETILESGGDPDLADRVVRCMTTKGPQRDCPLGWQDALTSGWIGSGGDAAEPAPRSGSEDLEGEAADPADAGGGDCTAFAARDQPELSTRMGCDSVGSGLCDSESQLRAWGISCAKAETLKGLLRAGRSDPSELEGFACSGANPTQCELGSRHFEFYGNP